MFTIKGNIIIDLHIPTMFNDYHMQIKDHNRITEDGKRYIFERLLYSEYDSSKGIIGKIGVGDWNETDDTVTKEKIFPYNPETIELTDDNRVVFTQEMSGADLDGTTQIRIYTSTKNVLISKNEHDVYSIPHTAIVTLTYSYELVNVTTQVIEDTDD